MDRHLDRAGDTDRTIADKYEDRGALHLSAPTPGNVLVTAESYERQSSQHPGYQGSEAQAYIRALIRAAYRATSDYADGEVVR